jgi:acyl carrier protein
MTRSGFKSCLEEILGVPAGKLRDSDGRKNIRAWTSLADVQILTTISSELGIEPDPELMDAETVGQLLDILETQRAFAG